MIFKTFQSATFMKTEYRNFEITVTIEHGISGKNEARYCIDEIGDKCNIVSGWIPWNEETEEEIIEQIKTRIDCGLESSDPRGIKFPAIPGAWVPISERLPPEELPVYTLSRSGTVGVYARFGSRFSSLISTDNEEICYWHESNVAQHIKRLQDTLAEIRLLIDIFPEK